MKKIIKLKKNEVYVMDKFLGDDSITFRKRKINNLLKTDEIIKCSICGSIRIVQLDSLFPYYNDKNLCAVCLKKENND